jgi:hypothetical protein
MTLTEQRDAALELLQRRWNWLDANPGHPLYREREDACLVALADYERLEDAIRMATEQSAFFVAAPADRYTS